jgi:OOP family OmpA-OmpF porin
MLPVGWFALASCVHGMSKRSLAMKTNITLRPFGVLLLTGAVAAAFAPAGAMAQQKAGGGWYSGISLGGTQIGMSDNVVPVAGATATTLAKDESGTGFKLFGGYRYSQNFAVEGGYFDFGNFTARRDVSAPVVGTISRTMKSSGFNVDAVGIMPLQSGFSLFGKVGLAYSMTKGSISTGGALLPDPALTSLSPKRSEWNPKIGLGASYDFSNGMGLRLEYERISNVGDLRTGEGNIGMWSLGLTKRY